MSDAGDGDVQQDKAALLLWSLGAWNRQQQRYREWLASNRRRQQRLRAISKVLHHAWLLSLSTLNSLADSASLSDSSAQFV